MARNCGATSRSAAARISAIASRRISGGGIEIACVTPLSSVSSRCSSVRLVRRAIPDHVVAAVARAQVVVGTRHRIAEELLAGRQAERHVLEQLAVDRRRNGLLRQQRTPGDIAGIERIEIGQKLLAHGRADAVGADQEIGLGAAAVAEMRHHRVGGLLEALQTHAAVIMRRAETRRAACGRAAPRRSASADIRPRDHVRPSASRIFRVVISTPRSAVSMPSARRRAITAGCATMPAPRPASSLSTRS